MNEQNAPEDRFNLARFLEAQEDTFDAALAEIREGRKQSHWMWFIFPQIAGLGFSAMSQRYAIKSLSEAEAYLKHPILGPRLRESAQAAVDIQGRSANQIFGSPDDAKLRSSVTLFAQVPAADPVFQQVLNKYFDGRPDEQTLRLLKASKS